MRFKSLCGIYISERFLESRKRSEYKEQRKGYFSKGQYDTKDYE